jgi:hypothetical protein
LIDNQLAISNVSLQGSHDEDDSDKADSRQPPEFLSGVSDDWGDSKGRH